MKIYNSGERYYGTDGYGTLSDAISALVTEERNGKFELEFRYPVDGILFDKIQLRNIVTAKPVTNKTEQPFRIYRITKPLNGIVTVYAAHESYDLSGIIVEPFTAGSATEAMQKIKANAYPPDYHFITWTNKSTVATMNNPVPTSVRALLGGTQGSILDTYGGELEFDWNTIKLHDHRGQDNGVEISYGKNLTDLTQEENCSKVRTAVFPFWKNPAGEDSVYLPEKVVNAPGTYDFVSILPVDFSSDFQEAPTVEQLRAKAEKYVKAHNIGVPKVSLKVSFVALEKCQEYKGLELLERVNLCDTVKIKFAKLGVDAKAKCIKTVYNVLLDRMENIELGEARSSLADTIARQDQIITDAISKLPTPSYIQGVVDAATATILGANGGSVRMLDENGDGDPDTLYIADNPDPAKAVKVWRFNYEGWGASKNGYNGPFSVAATLEEGFYADFITAGELNAGLIKAGVIQDRNSNVVMNLDTGSMDIKKGSINLGNGNFSVDDAGKMDIKSGNINLGNGNFTVNDQGQLNSVSGKIAGYNISGDSLYSNYIQLTGKEIYFRGLDNYGQVVTTCRMASDNVGYGNTFRITTQFNTPIEISVNRNGLVVPVLKYDPSDYDEATHMGTNLNLNGHKLSNFTTDGVRTYAYDKYGARMYFENGLLMEYTP